MGMGRKYPSEVAERRRVKRKDRRQWKTEANAPDNRRHRPRKRFR